MIWRVLLIWCLGVSLASASIRVQYVITTAPSDPLGLDALGAVAGSDLGGTIGSYIGALGTGVLGELGGGAAGTAAEPGGGTVAGGLAGAAAAADIGADVGGTIGSYLGGKLGDFLTGDDASASSPSLSIPDATVNTPAKPTPTIMCNAKKPPLKNPDTGQKKPSSAGKMNNDIDRGRAPNGVKRVDPADSNIPGSEPHVHYNDGTSSTMSGGVHDAGNGQPNPSNKIRDWLIQNGWTPPPKN